MANLNAVKKAIEAQNAMVSRQTATMTPNAHQYVQYQHYGPSGTVAYELEPAGDVKYRVLGMSLYINGTGASGPSQIACSVARRTDYWATSNFQWNVQQGPSVVWQYQTPVVAAAKFFSGIGTNAGGNTPQASTTTNLMEYFPLPTMELEYGMPLFIEFALDTCTGYVKVIYEVIE